MWINIRTRKKAEGLLPSRKKSNNYLEFPSEKALWNIMLSHWASLAWKFFMLCFHEILKFIVHKQSSRPKKISAALKNEESYLTWHLSRKFSYIYRTKILLNTCKQLCLMCFRFISKVKQSIHTTSGWSKCFEFLFLFKSVI